MRLIFLENDAVYPTYPHKYSTSVFIFTKSTFSLSLSLITQIFVVMTANSSLRMRRNCNLELRLSPTTTATAAASSSSADNGSLQSQQLTIFYNGRICVCDVTELQVPKPTLFYTICSTELSCTRFV